MLHAGLHGAFIFLRRINQCATFFEIVRQRFFDVDIFARRTRQHGNGRMPMIRRGDMHGVHVFRFQHFSKILKSVCRRASPRFGSFDVGQVNITERVVFNSWHAKH